MRTLYGSDLSELSELASEAGMPRFAASQMAGWLYRRFVGDISAMTDLPKAGRAFLAENAVLGLSAPITVSESADGTRKYLFAAADGGLVESALIPDGERLTLCVSSQVGCRMGCRFCMTGRQGLRSSLSAADILNQIISIPERDRLTNIVMMGMGEPLDNTDNVMRALDILTAPWGMGWSPTRITLSTSGVIPGLKRFLEESRVNLAVSLHNPFPEQRRELMPVEKAYPIRDVVSLIRKYDFSGQRRVSFEYILLEGINDSREHIKELCRLLGGLRCRINLIRFHRIPSSPYFSPPTERMTAFRNALTARGLMTTIRASRGEDIQAACGLLSTMAAGQVGGGADNS